MSDAAGILVLMGYYLVFLLLLPTFLKIWIGLPLEPVRKMQHVFYSLSIFLLLEMFSTWYLAIVAASLLLLLGYPALILLEKSSWYRKTFVDRTAKGGELRKQLIFVQISFALLIFIFWGLMGSNWHYIVAVAVMGWGLGDAAAALIGKAFGRRHFLHYLVDVKKTYEGTGAMIFFAGLGIFITLISYAGEPWYTSLLISFIVAPVCGIVELFSRRGTDTLTVPLSAAFSILSVVHILSFLGW